MDLFYAATTTTLGKGRKTLFWETSWVGGAKPLDIAPLIFLASKRKNWCVANALQGDACIAKNSLDENFTLGQVEQFIELWTKIQNIVLLKDMEDAIRWNLTPMGAFRRLRSIRPNFWGPSVPT